MGLKTMHAAHEAAQDPRSVSLRSKREPAQRAVARASSRLLTEPQLMAEAQVSASHGIRASGDSSKQVSKERGPHNWMNVVSRSITQSQRTGACEVAAPACVCCTGEDGRSVSISGQAADDASVGVAEIGACGGRVLDGNIVGTATHTCIRSGEGRESREWVNTIKQRKTSLKEQVI
jgi:hypothetical protein